jgi:hypothetical protein
VRERTDFLLQRETSTVSTAVIPYTNPRQAYWQIVTGHTQCTIVMQKGKKFVFHLQGNILSVCLLFSELCVAKLIHIYACWNYSFFSLELPVLMKERSTFFR